MKALQSQVGGNHYKDMPYQPAEFIYDLKLRFNPGAIIKYISRHKKDRLEDLRKAIHFCDICAELNDVTWRMKFNMWFPCVLRRTVWRFVKENDLEMPGISEEAITAVALGQWEKAKFNISILIDYETLKSKKEGC